MTKFRCKRSGHIISFSSIEDIESMRKEESYEEIKDEAEEKKPIEEPAEKRQVLKLKR